MKRGLFTMVATGSLLLKRKVPRLVIEHMFVLCIYSAFAAWGTTTMGRGEVDLRFVFASFAFATVTVACLVINWRRAKLHFARGHCTVCGYDLRATPGRCPECGTVVKGR